MWRNQTLINCMNSPQWILSNSFLGPEGLQSSSITPPASSKTLIILCTPKPNCLYSSTQENTHTQKVRERENLFNILKALQRSVWGLRIHVVGLPLETSKNQSVFFLRLKGSRVGRFRAYSFNCYSFNEKVYKKLSKQVSLYFFGIKKYFI